MKNKITIGNNIVGGYKADVVVAPKIQVRTFDSPVRKLAHSSMRLSNVVGVKARIVANDPKVKKEIHISNPVKNNIGIDMLMSSIKGVTVSYEKMPVFAGAKISTAKK